MNFGEAMRVAREQKEMMKGRKMFDEQPDGDPHGECAAEIKRLEIALRIKTEEHDCAAGDVIDLRNFIRKYAKDLTEIVRMPNAEYIADAHNEAVRRFRAEAGLK